MSVKNINIPKVLIAAPQADVKNYAWDKWISAVKNFSYPNVEIFLADNSITNKNYKRLLKQGIKSEWIKPKGRGIIERMALSHEACRRYAIKGKFDFMLHLETDIIPPTEFIIEELMFHNLPIVGAHYDVGFYEGRRLMIQSLENIDARFYKGSHYEEELFCDGGLKPCFHVGLGCILVRRDVFEKIPFRWLKGSDAHPDTYFAADLHQLGYQNYVDTSIFCEHYNKPWGKYGEDYW